MMPCVSACRPRVRLSTCSAFQVQAQVTGVEMRLNFKKRGKNLSNIYKKKRSSGRKGKRGEEKQEITRQHQEIKYSTQPWLLLHTKEKLEFRWCFAVAGLNIPKALWKWVMLGTRHTDTILQFTNKGNSEALRGRAAQNMQEGHANDTLLKRSAVPRPPLHLLY